MQPARGAVSSLGGGPPSLAIRREVVSPRGEAGAIGKQLDAALDADDAHDPLRGRTIHPVRISDHEYA